MIHSPGSGPLAQLVGQVANLSYVVGAGRKAALQGASVLAQKGASLSVGDKVLIVEDEPTLLETLEYNLSRQGYGVCAVADGFAGPGLPQPGRGCASRTVR